MTASNLAVCFVPAFFHLCGASDDVIGHPKRVKRPAMNKAAKELTSGLVSLTYVFPCVSINIPN